MRTMAAAFVLLALTACDSPTEPPGVPGLYQLSSVNGQSLPAPDDRVPGCDIVYVSGTLHLYQSGLVDLYITRDGTCPNGSTHGTTLIAGEWSEEDGSLSFEGRRTRNISEARVRDDGSISLLWRLHRQADRHVLMFRRGS